MNSIDPVVVLPLPVFHHIVEFLPESDLFHLSSVCKGWKTAMEYENGIVWRYAIERRWHTVPLNTARTHWRNIFVRKSKIDIMWSFGAYTTTFLPVDAFGVRLFQKTKAVCWDTKGNVIVFDLTTRKEEQKLHVHDTRIWWLAVSDSGMCVTASNDRTLKVVNICNKNTTLTVGDPSVNILRTLKGHPNPVWCVDFNESADIIASGSDKEELILWKLSTGEKKQTVHCDGVLGWYDMHVVPNGAGNMIPNGGTLVVAAARQSIVLINGDNGNVLSVIDKSHGRLPNFLAATPDISRGLIFASDTMRRLRIWSLETRRLVGELSLPGIAECVMLCDDKLYTGIDENGVDFYVMVWSLSNNPNEPEHLYDIVVDLPKGSRRLYAVEVIEDAIICCTQAEQLISINVNPDSKLPRRKKSKSPSSASNSSNSNSNSQSSTNSTNNSSASQPIATSRMSAEQQRARQQQEQQLATSPITCIIS